MKKRYFLVIPAMIVIVLLWFTACALGRFGGPGTQATLVQQTMAALSAQFTTTAEEEITEIATVEPSFTPRPTRTPTPTEAPCFDTKGRVSLGEMIIPETTRTLSFRVYEPPCYKERDDYDYPVLYLLHGQSYNDDQWDRLGADETADRLISSGEARPFLIVMPFEYYYLEDPRTSVYGSQITDHLIPWIDMEYDTCDARECRAIGGLSRGAGWAMHLGLGQWQLFGSVGAHSLALFPGDFYGLPYTLKEITDDAYPRIYMDDGTQDYMLDSTKNFEEQLTRFHVEHTWVINTGAHNEEYWAAHVEDYLYWYAFAWKSLPEVQPTGLPAATGQVEE